MWDQTIRDVVIRVAIESAVNSAMTDGIRGIDTVARAASERVDELNTSLRRLREVTGNSGFGRSVGQSAIPSQDIGDFGSSQSAFGRFTQRNRGAPRPGSLAERILSQGGATDDFAERFAQEGATNPTPGKSARNAGKAKGIKRLPASLNEQGPAIKAFSDQAVGVNTADANSSRLAANSAMEFGKALAFVALSSDRSNEAMKRNLDTAEGYFRLIRGGMNALQHVGDAIGQRSAAGGAEAGLAGRSLVANPYTVTAAVIAAALLFKRQMNIWEIENSKRESQLVSDTSGINANFAHQAVGQHVDQAIRLSNAVPNIGATRQTLTNARNRIAVEQQIQAEQAISTSDFAWRQEIRSRTEHAAGLRESQARVLNELDHAADRQESLEVAKAQLERDTRTSELAHRKRIVDLNRQVRQKTGVSRIRGMFTGEESDNAVDQFNLGIRNQLQALMSERKAHEVAQAEAGLRLEGQQKELLEKRVAAADQLLRVTREQVAAARHNFETDRQTAAAAHQALGGMSVAQQHVLKNIERKMAAGAKPDKWELDFIPSIPGLAISDEARRWREEAGKGLGFRLNVDVDTSKKQFENLKATQKDEEPELVGLIQKQGAELEKAQKRIADAVKGIVPMEEIAATFEKALSQERLWVQEQLRLLQQAWAGW